MKYKASSQSKFSPFSSGEHASGPPPPPTPRSLPSLLPTTCTHTPIKILVTGLESPAYKNNQKDYTSNEQRWQMQRRTSRANSRDSEMQSLPVTVKHMRLTDDTILMQMNFLCVSKCLTTYSIESEYMLKFPQTKVSLLYNHEWRDLSKSLCIISFSEIYHYVCVQSKL